MYKFADDMYKYTKIYQAITKLPTNLPMNVSHLSMGFL
jgi:hypothetical protein